MYRHLLGGATKFTVSSIEENQAVCSGKINKEKNLTTSVVFFLTVTTVAFKVSPKDSTVEIINPFFDNVL